MHELLKCSRVAKDRVCLLRKVDNLHNASARCSILWHRSWWKMLISDSPKNLRSRCHEGFGNRQPIEVCLFLSYKLQIARRAGVSEGHLIDAQGVGMLQEGHFNSAQQSWHHHGKSVETIRIQIEMDVSLHGCADRLVPSASQAPQLRNRLAGLPIKGLQRSSEPRGQE
jgi:hypothetical protein